MFFQTLDNKNGCVSYYSNGNFLEDLDGSCKTTWRQNSRLVGKNIDYIQIYCHGQQLDDICPEDMKDEKNAWLGGRKINWSHAFAIVDFFQSGLFTVHIIQIINGKTSLWGEVIDGNK